LCFFKMNFSSKIINWIGASSFSVYLLHTNVNVCVPIFVPYIEKIYGNYSGIWCLGRILASLLLIYIIAILLDQIRILMWKCVEIIFRKIASKIGVCI